MGLFKFYSHLFKPVAHRRELLLLLLSVALPDMVLLPFVRSSVMSFVVLAAWGILVATLYCLYKMRKHNN